MPSGKWDYPFLDVGFNLENPDEAYVDELSRLEAKPVVFIQGLHRSGTTFLLNSLYDLYGAASTTVYHIAYYRRLIHAAKNDEASDHQQAIAQYLEQHGLYDRQIDKVAVSPESLDEYGFIFDRLMIPRISTWMLREIRAKLTYLCPQSPLIFLKDPVVYASFLLLHAVVPDAKFVFIHRDPRRVLYSRFRSHITRLPYHTREPFMTLLMGRRSSFREMLASYFISRKKSKQQAIGMYSAHIYREVQAYLRELPHLPAECYLDVEYERLLDDTEATLTRIVDFIGIEPVKSLSSVKPSPRPPAALPPELVGAAESLRQRLEQSGYRHPG